LIEGFDLEIMVNANEILNAYYFSKCY